MGIREETGMFQVRESRRYAALLLISLLGVTLSRWIEAGVA
jgi:hypothetical protein